MADKTLINDTTYASSIRTAADRSAYVLDKAPPSGVATPRVTNTVPPRKWRSPNAVPGTYPRNRSRAIGDTK